MIRKLVTAIALAAFAAPVLAQQGPGPMTPEQRGARFDAADKNKDGKLDKTEWMTTIPEQMRANISDDQLGQMWSMRLDADGDGSVTRDQYVNMQMRRPQ